MLQEPPPLSLSVQGQVDSRTSGVSTHLSYRSRPPQGRFCIGHYQSVLAANRSVGNKSVSNKLVGNKLVDSPLVNTTSIASRRQLRQQLRQRRRALSPQQQKIAALKLARNLKRQPLFLRCKHIAFYLPNDGEIDPQPLIRTALQLGKHCYLPVLRPLQPNSLYFIRYTASSPLRPNRFNIPEPVLRLRGLPANMLDVVLLPLVGFDSRGGRLGMGGGFYDRTFAFKLSASGESDGGQRRPYLLGLAHSCQQVESLPLASWDIPLHAVVTDDAIFMSASNGQQRDFLPSLANHRPAD